LGILGRSNYDLEFFWRSAQAGEGALWQIPLQFATPSEITPAEKTGVCVHGNDVNKYTEDIT
jgi:hypothetical protein